MKGNWPHGSGTRATGSLLRSKALRLFLRCYARRAGYFVAFPIASLGISTLTLWNPWAMQMIVDKIIPSGRIGSLFLLIGSMILISVVTTLIATVNRALFQYGNYKVLCDVRCAMVRQVMDLEVTHLTRRGTGEILNRVSADMVQFGAFLSDTGLKIITGASTLTTSMAFLFHLDTRLLWACIAIMPLEFASAFLFKKKILATSRLVRDSLAKVSAFVMEILLAIMTIRALRMSSTVIDQLNYYHKEMLRAFRASQWVSALMSCYRSVVETLPTAVVFGYGGLLVIRGNLSLGALIAFYQVVGRIYTPVNSTTQVIISAIQARVPLERMDEILDECNCLPPAPAAEPSGPLAAPIRIRNVSFSYDGRKSVLNDINLDIPLRKTSLLVGPSGSGKSTLANLLAGTITPDHGTIRLGAYDLTRLADDEVHRLISLVDQKPVFFSCSIRENMRFAAPAAADDAIWRAIWVADLEDFVRRLPAQLDTKLNDRGTAISGGELRRLALARAALQSPRVLLLDETTSGVEPYAERQILDRIRQTEPDITLVIITHRMILAEYVDKLVFMEEGKIIGEGSHDHVSTTCSSYKKLYLQDTTATRGELSGAERQQVDGAPDGSPT
jgi:ABC-type bacteriocin/lantibiotic exporter with double-glycine peptidase domain